MKLLVGGRALGAALWLSAFGLAALLSATALAGCGQKGPPRPPQEVPPPKARSLFAVVRGNCVLMSWLAPKAVEGAAGPKSYQVLRSIQERPADPPAYRLLEDTAKLESIDCSLTPGQEALYAVRATATTGALSEPSNVVKVRMIPTMPPPSGLKLEPGDTYVELFWSAPKNAPPNPSYNVYRSQVPNAFPPRPVNSEPIKQTYYLDAPVERDKTYFYEVRLVATEPGYAPIEGEASASNCLTMVDVTPPPPPIGLAAIYQKEGVYLRWFHNLDADAAGYLVLRRCLGQTAFDPLTSCPIKETEWLDRTAAKNQEYEYMVQAVDAATPPNVSCASKTVHVLAGP